MGCTASKLDNEDTVRRCKERRRFMKEAVHARHHLAAAHSDYCRSLRITGSALTAFAAGEPLVVSDHSPAILLPNNTNPTHPRVLSPSPPPSSLHTPPPQQQPFSATHHYNHPRTKTPVKLPHILSESGFSSSPKNQQNRNQYIYNKVKPPIKLPHILSESSILSPPKNNPTNHFTTQKKPKPKVKLPHILSDSSISSTPKRQNTRNFTENYTYNANATYSTTPSQASSVWNWENFYPPSPPDSEFLNNNDYKNHQEREIDDNSSAYSSYNKHNPDMETASIYSNDEKKANNHHPNQQVHHQQQHHHLESDGEEEEETETEREEIQCSEWGDHYSTTSSSSDDEMTERESRSEVGTRSNFGSSVHSEAKAATFHPPLAAPSSKSDKFDDDAGSSVSWNNNNTNNAGSYENEISDMKIVLRHRDLAEIVAALKEYFDKAATAGEQVSEMLETGRAQLDRSFRQLKKTVYHSGGVLSNLSSSWTSKPPLAVKYRFEPGSMDEPGVSKSLCSTLERLLAWEKKLYQEVKAREGVKIEHEKKLSTLQSQEYRGDDEVKLNKTKASIKRLHSLIVVTSQAVSTTSSAINGLRDTELVPQLVELCHGFMYMWRSMNQFHEVQNHIVQQVRGLVNRSAKGESTSDLHRQATRDLESAVSAWHSCFCRLIKFQRDFICFLHGWFKLSLIPINSEPVNDDRESSEALSFCDEWKLALDRVPDTVASEAIKSFINVVHSISMKQAEELKIKKRTESASKELERKASSLRNIERKYYHSYSMVGIGLPDTGPDNSHALDARDPLSEKKSELGASQRRVEDEVVRHSKAVEVTRAMTLNNIRTGLPGVFQAMTSFSALIMEALEVVCTRSYAIK